jgi:hypothetical protein
MRPRKYEVLLVVVMISVLGGTSVICAQVQKPIKIGIPYPVTGPQASQGMQMKHAGYADLYTIKAALCPLWVCR